MGGIRPGVSSSCAFLLSLLLVSAPCASGDKVYWGPAIKILAISASGSIALEIGNPSRSALRLWQESNSWGAAHWRVLRIRHGHVEAFFQNPYQIFTANIPLFDEVAAGARVEHTLNLNAGNWCGFGSCASYNEQGLGGKRVSFEAKDVIVVIYDVPFTHDAESKNVWQGFVSAFKTME